MQQVHTLRFFWLVMLIVACSFLVIPVSTRAQECSDVTLNAALKLYQIGKFSEAIRMLDDILRRMAGHQAKKTSLLRALRAWDSEDAQ